MGIRQMLQRRKARKVFGEYVSPEVIKRTLREMAQIKPLEQRHIQYVVALADETNPHEIPVTVGKIVETFVEHKATTSPVT